MCDAKQHKSKYELTKIWDSAALLHINKIYQNKYKQLVSCNIFMEVTNVLDSDQKHPITAINGCWMICTKYNEDLWLSKRKYNIDRMLYIIHYISVIVGNSDSVKYLQNLYG